MSLSSYWEELQKTASEAEEAPAQEEELDKVAVAAELLNSMTEDELTTLFGKEAEEAEETEAKPEDGEEESGDEDEKVAQDLHAAGAIMAQGFISALNEAQESE